MMMQAIDIAALILAAPGTERCERLLTEVGSVPHLAHELKVGLRARELKLCFARRLYRLIHRFFFFIFFLDLNLHLHLIVANT